MNINVFILKESGGEKLLIESVGFPDATADETADLLATGVDPTKELLLYLPRLSASLDVFLQGRFVEIAYTAVVHEIDHGIELALSPHALHHRCISLKLLEILLQQFFGLFGCDLVALLDYAGLVDVERRLSVAFGMIAEDFGDPVALVEIVGRNFDFTLVGIGHSGGVPDITLAACAGGVREIPDIASDADRVIPDDGRLRHERETLHVLLILRGRVAQHLERRLVERHERHLVAARPDRTWMLAVAAIVADLVVVHRAGRIVHRAGGHADKEACDVVVAHILALLTPLHLLKPVDALEGEDIRVCALEADRAIRAVVVDEHPVLRASSGELLEKVRNLRVAAVHEVNLEALCAELGEMFGDLRLFAANLRSGHPEDNADATRIGILHEMRHVGFGIYLHDTELLGPAFIHDYILNIFLKHCICL